MPDLVAAYIALGSNLGDRAALLDEAIARLRLQPGIEVISVSSHHETEPVGGPAEQGKYLNAAAQLRTTLTALQLLHVLQAVETQLGRVRTERFGPRTIDLDLLLYGSEILEIQEPGCDLIVPHPRLHERLFVLEPLVEIAPLAVHPLLQSTAKDLLEHLKRPRESRRELAGQNAVITGSTSGIGRAIALALADAGANILVHGRRSMQAAESVAEECRLKQVDAQCFLADLRDENECADLVHFVWDRWPKGVDIWINNAGADTLTGEAAQWSFGRKLQELWAVDVRATMLLARLAGERMKRQGRGVILTMGWDQADTGMEGDSGQLFGACKAAVMAFTKSLALDLAPLVRVNCLAPGWIRTAWGAGASDAWQKRALRETPLARWGTPEDVAQTARWLVSPAAQFITGQIVRIDGGAIRG
jgi:2-amino-4-hydroxy-6-hydroxymethyldihydropteridine diphosphokinase